MFPTLDTTVFLAINHLYHPPLLTYFMIAFDYLTYTGLAWLTFCLLLIIFAKPKVKKLAKWGLLVVIFTTFIEGGLLKNIIHRPRPFNTLPNVVVYGPRPSDLSFPSGQATNAFAVILFYSLIFRRRQFTIFGFSLATLIGLNRIYLGDHYPLDVAAGIPLGLLCGWVSYQFYRQQPKLFS